VLREILQVGRAIEGDLAVIIFNPIDLKIAVGQTSEVDAEPPLVSLGLSRVKFDDDCWATQECIVERHKCATLVWDHTVQDWPKKRE
jgi:hypothetical protein